MSHDSASHETDFFEPSGWDERYAGDGRAWSGRPNVQLVAEAQRLAPGTALDVGSGEGGDVVWLAQQGWTVTGADFSANGIARAARHAEQAGVDDRVSWWQVDAREFSAGERRFDLVTSHFLHPAAGSITGVVVRLAEAVAPCGHLLVVGHAPIPGIDRVRVAAMFRAEDLVQALPDDFEVLVAEQRPRTQERDGASHAVEDATLLARRRH